MLQPRSNVATLQFGVKFSCRDSTLSVLMPSANGMTLIPDVTTLSLDVATLSLDTATLSSDVTTLSPDVSFGVMF